MAPVVTEIDRDAPLSEQLLLGVEVQIEELAAEIAQIDTTQVLLDLTQTPAEIETSQEQADPDEINGYTWTNYSISSCSDSP